jgi:hypothetical protein
MGEAMDTVQIKINSKKTKHILEQLIKKNTGYDVTINDAALNLNQDGMVHVKGNVQLDITYAKITDYIMGKL